MTDSGNKIFFRKGFRARIASPKEGHYQILDVSGINPRDVWTSREDLVERLTEVQLPQFAKDFAGYNNELATKRICAYWVWRAITTFYEKGRYIMSPKPEDVKGNTATAEAPAKKTKAKNFKFKKGTDREVYAKAAPQLQVILDDIFTNKIETISDTEMEKRLEKLVETGKLTTKQPPMRVFRYYIPKMRDEYKILEVS